MLQEWSEPETYLLDIMMDFSGLCTSTLSLRLFVPQWKVLPSKIQLYLDYFRFFIFYFISI